MRSLFCIYAKEKATFNWPAINCNASARLRDGTVDGKTSLRMSKNALAARMFAFAARTLFCFLLLLFVFNHRYQQLGYKLKIDFIVKRTIKCF